MPLFTVTNDDTKTFFFPVSMHNNTLLPMEKGPSTKLWFSKGRIIISLGGLLNGHGKHMVKQSPRNYRIGFFSFIVC